MFIEILAGFLDLGYESSHQGENKCEAGAISKFVDLCPLFNSLEHNYGIFKNILDHRVTSTLVNLALFRIKRLIVKFSLLYVRKRAYIFLKIALYVGKYTQNCTLREPNLNRNAVRWETQPSACIAGRLYQHFNVSSTLKPNAEYNRTV